MQGVLNVPGYTLVRRLDDSGGQATVHLGRGVAPPHREAAIKIYHSALRSSRDRQRFQREVEAMERLAADPHIIDVYDTGVLDNGQAYLAMRLCPGGSLAALLAERGPLSPAAVICLGETVAEALGRAHRQGVLHRDVKPHNILLGEDGAPVLADFGIVALRHQDSSATVGRWTAAYAAPELFHDKPATVKTDIYGLAATLYTMLAGHAPHHELHRVPSPAELLWRRNSRPASIDGVPPRLMNVLLQALSPSPNERFATADAFAAALRESVPAPTGRDGIAPRTALKLPGVDSRRGVKLTPGVQPGLLASALAGMGLVGLWGASLVPAGWTVWWILLTILIGLSAAADRVRLSIVTFVASLSLGLAIAVKGYDSSPFASIGWILAAFGVAVLAGAWGRSSSAVMLRWFAWRQNVKRRRWWGQISVRSEFTELETLPGARFIRLAEGTCHYAVTCGNAVGLVRWACWPDGQYVATDESVRRNGKVWRQGGNELERARRGPAALVGKREALRSKVFLAVDTEGEVRRRELRGDLVICHTSDLAETLGKWLADEPYEVNLDLLMHLARQSDTLD